jgi:hypothetical protein
MFYFSTHVTKKKIAVIFACLLIPVLIAALSSWINSNPEKLKEQSLSSEISASTREERIAFLSEYGWIADGNTESICEATIPSPDDSVFSEYLNLQKSQGFSLEQFAGRDAVQYTYKITNYPENPDYVYANILVLDGIVIGGDIHDSRVGGFVEGFGRKNAH